jgi:hypothetical protein
VRSLTRLVFFWLVRVDGLDQEAPASQNVQPGGVTMAVMFTGY